MAEEQPSLELTPTSLKMRGTDYVNMATFLVVVVAVAFNWVQADDGKKRDNSQIEAQQQVATAIKEFANVQRESSKNQRLMTCILSRPEAERKKEFEAPNSFCQQVTR